MVDGSEREQERELAIPRVFTPLFSTIHASDKDAIPCLLSPITHHSSLSRSLSRTLALVTSLDYNEAKCERGCESP